MKEMVQLRGKNIPKKLNSVHLLNKVQPGHLLHYIRWKSIIPEQKMKALMKMMQLLLLITLQETSISTQGRQHLPMQQSQENRASMNNQSHIRKWMKPMCVAKIKRKGLMKVISFFEMLMVCPLTDHYLTWLHFHILDTNTRWNHPNIWSNAGAHMQN